MTGGSDLGLRKQEIADTSRSHMWDITPAGRGLPGSQAQPGVHPDPGPWRSHVDDSAPEALGHFQRSHRSQATGQGQGDKMLSFPQEFAPGSVATVRTAEDWQQGALGKALKPVPISGQWRWWAGPWGHRRPPGEEAAGEAPPGPVTPHLPQFSELRNLLSF